MSDIDETGPFLDVLAERNRLLIVLFQFPVSFKFTKYKEGEPVRLEGNWDHVADVLNAFKEYPKAIEFRHETWDDPWVLSALREHRTAWVWPSHARIVLMSTPARKRCVAVM